MREVGVSTTAGPINGPKQQGLGAAFHCKLLTVRYIFTYQFLHFKLNLPPRIREWAYR